MLKFLIYPSAFRATFYVCKGYKPQTVHSVKEKPFHPTRLH